jgi:hypothetical protein
MVVEIKTERALYAPTERFLYVSFLTRLREQSALGNLQLFASDTSAVATSDGGQWTRPDLAALVLGRGQFIPHWKADLHTFEVKTAAGLSETSVHEANAHGRFSNYSWLVFQAVGRAAIQVDGLTRRISRLASHLGVGLVHFVDPNDPNEWLIEVWPRRTGTDPSTADNFVRQRFSDEARARIAKNLRSLGWCEEA